MIAPTIVSRNRWDVEAPSPTNKTITPHKKGIIQMNYEQSIDYIHSIPKFRRPLGNANLEKLLTQLDNPQKKLKFIHIAGTNGKGSTAAMTAEILKKSGFKTGR